ncbi:hypothetical protein MHK_009553 [Candidatus Magnetomorum sp. HK-1]|nr:hypothetical protein MHK_009553 [Candidatus Magnetomorum sp. HK-1]
MKIVLHIGFHKTGTTFLQSKIFPKIKDIKYLGKYYDKRKNIIDDDFIDYIQYSEYFDYRIPQQKILEYSKDSSILISWERLLRPYRLERNAERLSKVLSIFDDLGIIITIRRQDNLIWSRFQHDSLLFKTKYPDQLEKSLFNFIEQCAYPKCFGRNNQCSCMKRGVKSISLPFYNFLNICSLYSFYFNESVIKILPLELLEKKPQLYLNSLFDFLDIKDPIVFDHYINNKVNSRPLSQRISRQPFEAILANILNYYKYSNKKFSEKYNLKLDSYGYY